MNLAEKLIKIRSLIEGVNDVGKDLTFRFEAAQFCDVAIGNQPACDAGRLQVVYEFVVEPEPRAVFRTKPATTGDFLTRDCVVTVELVAYGSKLGRGMEEVEGFTEKIRWGVTEHSRESIVRLGNGAIGMKHREQLAGSIDESLLASLSGQCAF